MATLFLVPKERVDVAKLRPIEVIAVYKAGDMVTMVTDTEDEGHGPDVLAALADMRRTSEAVIYLDTAEYLILGEGTEAEVAHLRKELKGNVKLCKTAEKVDLKKVAQYMSVHGDMPCLRRWQEGQILPMITPENDKIKILKNMKMILDNTAGFC